jgi:hypothetical protein
MLVRVMLLLAVAGLVPVLGGCSSLTKPDEIVITPEPAPVVRQAPPSAPAPGAIQRPQPQFRQQAPAAAAAGPGCGG